MDFFVGQTFDSHTSFVSVKNHYENSSNTILSISRADKISSTDQLSALFKYRRLTLSCKAGPERKCQSKGMRRSSTIKLNCPFEVKIVLDNNKYRVKSMNSVHESHNVDRQTYLHYPENMRLTPDEKIFVEGLVKCGANKQRVKIALMEKRNGRPVALKAIHNVQTKVHVDVQQLVAEENELEKLLEKMQQIPNARVKVVVNESNELVGIYFQDERMAKLFEKYPEVLLIDATYKLNNRGIPLFILLVVDGNGESEIACLWFIKSESKESISPLVDAFKELNGNWTNTKVIISDKDFSERSVFQEKFLGIPLQICLFHVLRNFNREMTSVKRKITTAQREQVLEILYKMAYSRTSTEYDMLYQQLLKLELPMVTKYFNENWHDIKNEWTMHGKNEWNNYMNYTTNRVESLNQKLKIIGNHYAKLLILTFFENVILSCTVISSEKDIKAVKQSMKVSRVRFNDIVLSQYNDFLTPYIFEKVAYEYERINKVNLTVRDEKSATMRYGDYHEIIIEMESCNCSFFKTMQLPCRHIFKFRQETGLDLFVPGVCAVRWSKRYYFENHPALNTTEPLASKPVNIAIAKVPEEITKYKSAAKVTKEINSLMSTLSTGQYTYFIDKLTSFRKQITSDETHPNKVNEPAHNDIIEDFLIDLSSNTRILDNSDVNAIQSTLNCATDLCQSSYDNSFESGHAVISSEIGRVYDSSESSSAFNCSENVPNLSESSSGLNKVEIRKISLPSKHIRIGRPKGSGRTVVGTKKKSAKCSTSSNVTDRITRSKALKRRTNEPTKGQRMRVKF